MAEKSNYEKTADLLKRKSESIINAVNNISQCIQNKEFKMISIYEGKLVSASRGLSDAINRLISYTGNDPAQIADQYAAETCEISIDRDIVNIRFGDLLPHREKRGVETYTSSIPYIRAFYKAAKERLQGISYSEPVVLAFLHHYAANEDMVDHDNLIYKPFIDAISVSLLKDDSPRQCSHFMGHVMDDHTFSEIYILPENIFPQFLQSHLSRPRS